MHAPSDPESRAGRTSFRPSPPARTGILVPRGAVLASAGIGLALLAWAGAATWYIACRDEFAGAFLARQTEMRFGYEDRIAELSRRLEGEVTLGLAQRDGVDARLRQLADRQAQLEARQGWLRRQADGRGDGPEATGSLAKGDGSRPAVDRDGRPAARARPPQEAPVFQLRSGSPDEPAPAPVTRLDLLERRVEAAGAAELDGLTRLAGRERGRLLRLRAALDATGLPLDRRDARSGSLPVGGPLVPLPEGWRTGAFGRLATDLEETRGEARRLAALAGALPLGQPLSGELDVTSGFGTRFDPFTRAVALHTGADFRADWGAPVRATGAGRVVAAEWSGGYGNMVEIDHGDGIVTRYGHLSGFAVAPGDRVRAGDLVGRAGSTGRSTGTHVHYETRLNGEPVNPTRFLSAGRLLDPAAE